jgi:hypothetical protein
MVALRAARAEERKALGRAQRRLADTDRALQKAMPEIVQALGYQQELRRLRGEAAPTATFLSPPVKAAQPEARAARRFMAKRWQYSRAASP